MTDYDPERVRNLPVEEQAHIARDLEYEMDDLLDRYNAEAEPVPVIRRELGLNERLGFWQWIPILEVLASARTEPFLPEMGLGFVDPEKTRAVARRAIERFDDFEQHLQAQDSDDDEDVLPAVEIIEDLLDHLEAEQGTEVAERFLEYVVRGSPRLLRETRQEDAWQTLLTWICPERVRFPHPDPPLPTERVEALRDIVRRRFDASLVVRCAVAEQMAGDEWEERLDRRLDRIDELHTVLDEAQVIIEYRNFRRAWREIWDLLDDRELEVLLAWGKDMAPRTLVVDAERLELPPAWGRGFGDDFD